MKKVLFLKTKLAGKSKTLRLCADLKMLSVHVPCWSSGKTELVPDLPASWLSARPSCILSASPKASSCLNPSLYVHRTDP